jgi:glycosidase
MSVILDWVSNHTAWDHPWITAHKDWYMQNAGGAIISPPGTGWNDVAQLNFNSMAMRKEMIKSMKYWVFEANIDGFRFDYADGPPLDFWKQAVDTLRNITTHKLLLFAEGGRSGNYSVGFDFNFGFGFFDKLKTIYGSSGSAQLIDQMNANDYTGATGSQQMIRYTSNHDVNGAEGTPMELFGGTRGSIAAFAVVSLMKSVPMIYGGQEVATPIRLTFPFTSTKIDWSINPDIKAEYKKIIAFRNGSNAVRRGTLQSFSTSDVVAFTKEMGAEKVTVIINMRNTNINYTTPPTLVGTSWTNAMNNSATVLGATVSLQPYEYLLLKN